jgi:ABC-type Fe3+/spermidine/putrescine transport system ATPase subunit
VAEFIGASTVLRGRATAPDRVALPGGELRVLGVAGLRAGEAVELAIRPERIRLTGETRENVMDGRVAGVVYQGVQTELTVEIGGGQRLLVFVAEPALAALAPGQTVRLHLPADAFIRLEPEEAGR